MSPKFMAHWRGHKKDVNSQLVVLENVEGRNPTRIQPKRGRTMRPMEDVEEEIYVQPPRDREETIIVRPPPRRIIPPLPEELQNAYTIGDALVSAGMTRSPARENLYYRLTGTPLLAYWQGEGVKRSPFFSVETPNVWLRYQIVAPMMVQDYDDEQEPIYFEDLEELITHMIGVVKS